MYCLIAVMVTCASFHFCTLEEYYTGGLFLGPFNGVTDGSVGIILLFLLMSLTGNQFWAGTIGESVRLVDIVIMLLILG